MLYMPTKSYVKEPKDEFVKLIAKDFSMTLKLDERITLIADVNHFRIMEDEFVWNQAKGRIPNYYEVYFDGIWVCDFMDDEKLPDVRLKFLKGFLDKYEKGEVFLTSKEERVEQEVESAIDKAIRKNKNKKIESEEDFIVQQAVDGMLKEKKKPTSKSKSLSSNNT